MSQIRKRAFELTLGFAVGMAWVLAALAALLAFLYTLPFGIFSAISSAIIGFAVGLVPVFLLEAVFMLIDMRAESKKQTKILEQIKHLVETKNNDG